jgi:hypothetical protein
MMRSDHRSGPHDEHDAVGNAEEHDRLEGIEAAPEQATADGSNQDDAHRAEQTDL